MKRDYIPFVLGGSRDLFQGIADAYLAESTRLDEASTEHQVTFLSVNHSLDVQPLLSENQAHQTSVKRYFIEKMRENY